ncbi:tetratricopeptide repeat protein [Acaryochloris sp. IP29b_bin.148]|uniref:tetratricopeptide repeat protein n=1 Tax=Acaryochloris sp. IP29b_bin.148 TaxID=2969218 RepID=UPI0026381BB5|nr:tetratricopeptide repeat protein [Acaryochloris sp. IP29b_bin.148]
MNAPSKPKSKTFNLLSIGHRGVGKTVFLAGSYAEQKSSSVSKKSSTWLECQDAQVQKNLNTLLEYIAQTGQYPPATMKITNFTFTAKSQNLFGTRNLCRFRWWDIPGEICKNENPNFQKMVLESHGCCVFIDTYTLLNDGTYTQILQGTIKQVETIASLAQQSGIKYLFAIILTKCDLLTENPQKLLKIEDNIKPLMARLDANQINYRRFYSTIPIATKGKMSVLRAKGASAPFLWLVTELSKIYRQESPQSLASGFSRLLDNTAQPLTKSRQLDSVLKNKQLWGVAGIASLLTLLIALLIGFDGLGLFKNSAEQAQLSPQELVQKYQAILEQSPDDPEALLNLSRLYSDLTEFDKALPLMEKLVSQQPEKSDFLFELAGLYALNGKKKEEENVYDKILKLDPKSILALTSKATLRIDEGDTEAATTLFAEAETAAPTDELKQEIRKMAQEAQARSKPNP